MSSPPSRQWRLPAASPAVAINAGTFRPEQDEQVTEDNLPGLKLVLMLKGRLQYTFPGQQRIAVAGPTLHLSLSRRPFQLEHLFHRDQTVEYVAIRMPEDSLETGSVLDGSQLAQAWRRPAGDTPFVLNHRADTMMQALARQVLLCPLHGPLRSMYLTGKAMELTATALSSLCAGATASASQALDLPLRQRECLLQARDILQAQCQEPPDLASLARQAGLSVSALTRGFRQMFGCSVYEYVRQLRLDQAYQLLASGACSVSQAAWRCGYSDAHFSRAFQKRFGVSPRHLRG